MPDMGDAAPSGKGGFSMSGGGANLNYIDDDLDSYSTIWEGEVTKTDKKDHRKVVTALKNISEGTDLETYLDVDNVLKYMAVHTFAVNMDSLSGSMAHNYYLYEYDDQESGHLRYLHAGHARGALHRALPQAQKPPIIPEYVTRDDAPAAHRPSLFVRHP